MITLKRKKEILIKALHRQKFNSFCNGFEEVVCYGMCTCIMSELDTADHRFLNEINSGVTRFFDLERFRPAKCFTSNYFFSRGEAGRQKRIEIFEQLISEIPDEV